VYTYIKNFNKSKCQAEVKITNKSVYPLTLKGLIVVFLILDIICLAIIKMRKETVNKYYLYKREEHIILYAPLNIQILSKIIQKNK